MWVIWPEGQCQKDRRACSKKSGSLGPKTSSANMNTNANADTKAKIMIALVVQASGEAADRRRLPPASVSASVAVSA